MDFAKISCCEDINVMVNILLFFFIEINRDCDSTVDYFQLGNVAKLNSTDSEIILEGGSFHWDTNALVHSGFANTTIS